MTRVEVAASKTKGMHYHYNFLMRTITPNDTHAHAHTRTSAHHLLVLILYIKTETITRPGRSVSVTSRDDASRLFYDSQRLLIDESSDIITRFQAVLRQRFDPSV